MFHNLQKKIAFNSEKLFYVIPVTAIFGLVYLCSLTFKYVEGDDATSVAFHALGRNPNLQPPYSPYHGMMDIFLYLVPNHEPIIRYVAVGITAISSIGLILLIINLVKEWLPNLRRFNLSVAVVVILLCIPEVFYLSLFYTPSLTAMCFVLISHLLLRNAVIKQDQSKGFNRQRSVIFILSAMIFGIGVACRWDIGLYLIVIFADLILNKTAIEKHTDAKSYDSSVINSVEDTKILNYRRIGIAFFFGISAISASFIAIFLSGYGLTDIFTTLKLADKEITSQDSIFATIGAYQAFFTPAFLLYFLVGFVRLLIKRKSTAFFVAITIVPFLVYVYSREPKMILPTLPSFFLAMAVGINFMWFEVKKKHKVWLRILMLLIIALPWFIGVKVTSPSTAWGPGFEIKTLDNYDTNSNISIIEGKVEERKVSIQDFRITFGSGFAIPTPEGARPLGGHFYTLIAGQWRNLVEKLDSEKDLVIQKAITRKLNILQDDRNAGLITKLLEMNYGTNEPKDQLLREGIYDRTFFRNDEKILIQTLQKRSNLFLKKTSTELLKNNKEVIIYSGYSSTIKKLKDTSPGAIQVLGPFSAIIDLDKYIKSNRLKE